MSPSERYAAHMKDKDHPVVRHFSALYDFPLDDFQLRACREIEDGRGVLVAAPTGSGKPLVGEVAIHPAPATGRKCFYTTPIKALSNQKYHDLVERYGPDEAGLLTGDNVVNGEAPGAAAVNFAVTQKEEAGIELRKREQELAQFLAKHPEFAQDANQQNEGASI